MGTCDFQLVEDLIDSGLTMQRVVAKLHEEKPQSIRVATLAVKRVSGIYSRI